MITLHKLKVFMTVVDRGSFNQAAQDLYMAQSAVSQHIAGLEAALGTALFERSARGVRTTAAGNVLYDYARRMLALLSEAERAIMQIDRQQSFQLSVGATPGISVYLLPAWLQQFQQTHAQNDNLAVSMQTALTFEIVRDVLNGRYDLGFLEGELLELDDENLGRWRLFDLEYHVVTSAAHPLAAANGNGARISIPDLNAQAFINRQPASRTRRWLEMRLAQHGIRLHTVAELDSPGAIKYALLNQMGVSILPAYAVERETERGELRQLDLVDENGGDISLKRPLMMVWNKRQPFSAIQRAFIGMLASEVPSLQILL